MAANKKKKPVLKMHKPKDAPKVPAPKPADGNYMKEGDTLKRLKSPMWPMKQKRLSK
jgi:hypothetical protein